jgi:hypothetical protein
MSLIEPEFDHSFLGLVPYPKLSSWQLCTHSMGRCLVVWLALIHPITICLVAADDWTVGLVLAVLFAIIPFGVHGTLFYMFSQVSHVQHECFDSTAVTRAAPRAMCSTILPPTATAVGSAVPATSEVKAEATLARLDGLLSRWRHSHPVDEITLRKEQRTRWEDASLAAAKMLWAEKANKGTNEQLTPPVGVAVGRLMKEDEAAAQNIRVVVASVLGTAEARGRVGGGGGGGGGEAELAEEAAEEVAEEAKKEWAVHQVEHTLDYAIDSTFWLHVSNGLNLQAVHHLFPQIGWGHYKDLAPIIERAWGDVMRIGCITSSCAHWLYHILICALVTFMHMHMRAQFHTQSHQRPLCRHLRRIRGGILDASHLLGSTKVALCLRHGHQRRAIRIGLGAWAG